MTLPLVHQYLLHYDDRCFTRFLLPDLSGVTLNQSPAPEAELLALSERLRNTTCSNKKYHWASC